MSLVGTRPILPDELEQYSCNARTAKAYARILSSYWADKIESSRDIIDPRIDFIVTPKGGSPILGYEFANLLGKPFVLHEETERFNCKENDMRKFFNCAEVPKKNSRANGISDKQFFYWQRILRKEAFAASTSKELSVITDPADETSPRKISFAEISLPIKQEPVRNGFQPDIIIRKGAVSVEISNSVSAELLSRIGEIFHAE